MTLKFVDLFCGLGAFHEALKSFPTECVFACDIDHTVSQLYHTNHHIRPHGDITKIHVTEIPPHDLLCAGAPCQSHSVAGKQKALDDPRGQLIYDIFRIVKHHQPKYIVIENVKNLLNVQQGRVFKEISQNLERLNYNVNYKVLNAARYNTAQARERLYLVCIRSDLSQQFTFPPEHTTPVPVRRILDLTVQTDMRQKIQEKYETVEEPANTSEFKPRTCAVLYNRKSGKGGRQGERIYDINHPAITVCASSGGPGAKTGLYRMPNQAVRTLNVSETMRLFGFNPNTYTYRPHCSDTQMLHYLGNSIVIPVLSQLFNSLL